MTLYYQSNFEALNLILLSPGNSTTTSCSETDICFQPNQTQDNPLFTKVSVPDTQIPQTIKPLSGFMFHILLICLISISPSEGGGQVKPLLSPSVLVYHHSPNPRPLAYVYLFIKCTICLACIYISLTRASSHHCVCNLIFCNNSD